MTSPTDQMQSIFAFGLRNQHAVENQAIELLERQIGRLQNYPEMEDRLRLHLTETQDQARRIEDLLSQLGTSHSSLKDAALSVMGNMMAIGHSAASDEILKNTMANFAFENFEIASYRTLLTVAELSGHQAAIPVLRQSLAEETAMAEWIADHIDGTVRTYVARSVAGETAGR